MICKCEICPSSLSLLSEADCRSLWFIRSLIYTNWETGTVTQGADLRQVNKKMKLYIFLLSSNTHLFLSPLRREEQLASIYHRTKWLLLCPTFLRSKIRAIEPKKKCLDFPLKMSVEYFTESRWVSHKTALSTCKMEDYGDKHWDKRTTGKKKTKY